MPQTVARTRKTTKTSQRTKGATAPKIKLRGNTPKIPKVAGLRSFLVLGAVAKRVDELKKDFQGELSDSLKTTLLTFRKGDETSLKIGDEDDNATALASFRKRDKRSPLSLDEIKVLTEAKIPLKPTPKKVCINERYLGDEDVLKALARILQNNPGILPPDFLTMTNPEIYVDDVVVERVLAKAAHDEKARNLVDIIGSIVVSRGDVTYEDGGDVDDIVDEVLQACGVAVDE